MASPDVWPQLASGLGTRFDAPKQAAHVAEAGVFRFCRWPLCNLIQFTVADVIFRHNHYAHLTDPDAAVILLATSRSRVGCPHTLGQHRTNAKRACQSE